MYEELFTLTSNRYCSPVYGPQHDTTKSSTRKKEIHQLCGYALTVVEFGTREVLKFELKRGENVVKELVTSL